MNKASMNVIQQIVTLLLVACVTVHQIDGAQKIDVDAEINKMTEKFGKLERPSPAMINAVMEQFRESCRTNRSIDNEALSKNVSQCMGGLFNETAMANELKEAIPKGNLENVFRNICLKWPKVKECLKPGLEIIEECWANGTLVNSGMDTMVDFFCGKDNDGAYIALFFAEGGLSCLEAHGDKVRDCVNEHNTEEHQENLCLSVQQIHDCLDPLRICADVTPHNLVASMVREVGKVMQCPTVVEHYRGAASDSSSRKYQTWNLLNTGIVVSLFLKFAFN